MNATASNEPQRIAFRYDASRPLLPPPIRGASLRWTNAEADPAASERTFRAFLDGNDVGAVVTLIEVCDDGRLAGTVRSLGVVPDCRGQEYEIDLLVHATAFLKMAGVSSITCEAEAGDAAMLAALKRVGYTRAI